jgi:hypothetical protein
MATIIYEQTPGALIPTGDRVISTFPSGLVRVDQSFSCKTSSATTHRNALAVGNNFPNGNYPAIDGLNIFPEPQEKIGSDGFTEFLVSAYGRTTTDVNDVTIPAIYNNVSDSSVYIREGFIRKYVVKKGETFSKPIDAEPTITQTFTENASATISLTSLSGAGTFNNPWGSVWVSFRGTGVVTISDFNITNPLIYAIINGISANHLVKVNVGLQGSPFAKVSVTGSVTNLSATRFDSIPPPTETLGVWYQTSIDVQNYGHYTEVTQKFEAI